MTELRCVVQAISRASRNSSCVLYEREELVWSSHLRVSPIVFVLIVVLK